LFATTCKTIQKIESGISFPFKVYATGSMPCLLPVLLWQNWGLIGWVVAMLEKNDWWKASAEECFAEAKARIAHAQETGSDTLEAQVPPLPATPVGV
jgi:hypothetical protein